MVSIILSFCLPLDSQLGKESRGCAFELRPCAEDECALYLLSHQRVLVVLKLQAEEARNPPVFIGDLILKTAYLPVVISDASLKAAQDSCCLALPPLQPH